MILAISQFRVANGMEREVSSAFGDRPRAVDQVPGFLGLEVFTDSTDPSIYHLVTRWTDERSYRAWHDSDAHRMSHALMPKGLELDPTFTQLLVVERIPTHPGHRAEAVAADAAPVLSSMLESSHGIHAALADREGTITWCNGAFASSAKTTAEELVGAGLWELLLEPHGSRMRAWAARGERSYGRSLLLRFGARDGEPYSLDCRIDVQPDGLLLLGEPDHVAQAEHTRTLLEVQGKLQSLTREHARQTRELRHAQAELERTHWQIRKIAEVMPICVACRKVKTGEAQWEDLADLLQSSTTKLSHGYCPQCGEAALAELEEGEDSP